MVFIKNLKLVFYLKTLKVYLVYKLKQNHWISKILPSNLGYIPFLAIINLTSQCPLNCKHCYPHWKGNSSLKKEHVFSFIDECSQLGVPLISFTGGEPLMYKYLFDVADYARNKKISLNLNTCGYLISENNIAQINKYFDYVRISLHGFEEIQDKISNTKGAYKRINEAINLLMSIPNRKVKVGINFVTQDENISEMVRFINHFEKKVDFISILPYLHYDGNKLRDTKLKSINVDYKKYFYTIKKLNKKNKLGHLLDFLINPSPMKSKELCAAGELYISVFSDGRISPCPFSRYLFDPPFYIDHRKQHTLKELINIFSMNNKKNCVGCYATCTTEISQIFKMPSYELLFNFFKLRNIFMK